MSVIEFRKPERHVSGPAFCLHCRHEWAAVAPTGEVQLQCPQCQTMRGLFKFPCAPAPKDLIWICACGNDLFHLTTYGHLCPKCGTVQNYD